VSLTAKARHRRHAEATPRLPRLLLGPRAAERVGRGRTAAGRAAAVLGGRAARWLLLAASLACGLFLAAATLHLTARWG
jgi:hypothetical protein